MTAKYTLIIIKFTMRSVPQPSINIVPRTSRIAAKKVVVAKFLKRLLTSAFVP